MAKAVFERLKMHCFVGTIGCPRYIPIIAPDREIVRTSARD